MTVRYQWKDHAHHVSFDDVEEALRFVMDWQFGYAGPKHHVFAPYKRWGLPIPSDAPDHMDLDAAITKGLKTLLGEPA